jgi:uncharacterized protein involved in exopolysaccharide biosynthesis
MTTRNADSHGMPADFEVDDDDEGISLGELFSILRADWKRIIGGALGAGLVALGVAFLLPPVYTARTAILPPQQSQSSATAALSNLGALAGLAGLAGGAGGIKSPADQYVAMMQSITVSNSLIDKYKLMDVYDSKFRVDAQKELADNVRVALGKKDGLITIEVDDVSPERSAAMANSYVDALRSLTKTLAVTEAQQRRVFFEQQLHKSKENLTQAQVALQGSGFNAGALKAEPKAAAEGYAKLRAEVTAGEVRLQAFKGMLADNAPEITQLQGSLSALRSQLARFESGSSQKNDADYIGRYREFKYHETLFELFARQYELARVDESREGALIQVLDVATAPERKSKPKRVLIAGGATALALFAMSIWVLMQHFRRIRE